MDRSYIVFDEDPHGNRDMPLYFLRKLHVDFILGKYVNYFDITEFQGIQWGMHQNREHAKADPHCVCLHPLPWTAPPPIYILPHLAYLIKPKFHYCSYLRHFISTKHILRAMESPVRASQRHQLVDMLEGSHPMIHNLRI